jgi:hypothetical protein
MLKPAATLALLALSVCAPSARAAYVLPPTAERELVRILQLEGPAPDPYALQVAIDKDRVRVTASQAGAVKATLTLVHPDGAAPRRPRASPGSPRSPRRILPIRRPPRPSSPRLAATGRAVTWSELSDPVASDPGQAGADAKRQTELHEQLDVALYKTALGELETARTVLGGLPADLPSGMALQVATAWRLAGAPDKAEATLARLTDLDPAQRMAATAIRGQTDLDLDAALGDTAGAAACERIAAAAILARLGLADQALRYAQAVRERAPDCARAWESELHRLLDAHRTADAAALADQAVLRFPDDDQLLSLAASIFNAHGEYRKARAHPRGRRPPPPPTRRASCASC